MRKQRPRIDPNSGVLVKTCKRCGESKPFVEFGNKGYKPNGDIIRAAYCAVCYQQVKVERTREWRIENADEIMTKRKARYTTYTRDRIKGIKQERKSSGLCVRCGKVPALTSMLLCSPCRDYTNTISANQRTKARDKGLCYTCKKNPIRQGGPICEQCLARARVTVIKRYHKIKWPLRLQVIQGYGGKCVCCGESNPAFLTVDHVANDGKKERAVSRNKIDWMRRIINSGFPDNYQILCYNCNCSKGIYGVCAHTLTDEQIAKRDAWWKH